MKSLVNILLLLVIVWSCNTKNISNTTILIPAHDSFLNGSWKNTISTSPDFKIANDSIVFLQEDSTIHYLYTLKKDSLTIHFPKFSYTFKLECFKGDSLHLINEMGSNTFNKL
ncbi:MAG: hypothetical protein IT267_02850 [Saprospiraceae bacterium]|nr:hypothetical protein [Saprospiraceae bacterium]